jgi:putative oligomerization/nucleic acid binding protein
MPIIILLAGVGIITFAVSCFKEIPFIGTVLTLPGENILNAKVVDPVFKYMLILIGIGAIIYGILYLVKQSDSTLVPNINVSSNSVASHSNSKLSYIKEAKDLLDSGAITDEEFNKIKTKLLDS